MCWSMFTLSISTHHLGCFVAGLVLWQHAPLVDLLNHVDMFHTHVLQATTTMSTRFMLTCFHLRFLICRALLAGRGVLVLFSGGRVSSLLGSENVNLL